VIAHAHVGTSRLRRSVSSLRAGVVVSHPSPRTRRMGYPEFVTGLLSDEQVDTRFASVFAGRVSYAVDSVPAGVLHITNRLMGSAFDLV
jgi:hypothetical protein